MVEDLDAEELAGGGEPAREGDVLGRWLGIAARVVVGQQERGAAGEDRRLENFARVDERARQAAYGDRVQSRGRDAGS